MGRGTAVARISQPTWLNPAIMNGFGFIPRRSLGTELAPGTDQTALRSIDQILILAKIAPLKVLTMLPDVIPEVSKCIWNNLRLGCGNEAVRLKAVKRDAKGVTVEEAPDGNEAIRSLFLGLPSEVGDFGDLLRQNYLMTQFSGMCVVECVPGKRNQGVKEVWPVDTLTLRFRRDKSTGLNNLWQRQRLYGLPIDRKAYGGFIPLPMQRTFYSALDGFPDDPYGRAPLAAMLNPVLEIIAFMKDLLLAWHRVGTPKYDIGFDYEMHAKVAVEIMGMTDKALIEAYVEQQFQNAVNTFQSLQPDDAFLHDNKSTVSVNGSGGKWPNVEQIWNLLRWRLIVAMHEMPTLMGVVEGNTETWSSVDWQIYAKGLETLVAKAAAPLVRAAEYHLQLLGMPYFVEAEYSPVRANQRMVDAQSEQLEIDNEARKRDEGWQTQDEASLHITGSASVAEPDLTALGVVKPEPSPSTGPGGPSKAT
jgi:hypothetical protein